MYSAPGKSEKLVCVVCVCLRGVGNHNNETPINISIIVPASRTHHLPLLKLTSLSLPLKLLEDGCEPQERRIWRETRDAGSQRHPRGVPRRDATARGGDSRVRKKNRRDGRQTTPPHLCEPPNNVPRGSVPAAVSTSVATCLVANPARHRRAQTATHGCFRLLLTFTVSLSQPALRLRSRRPRTPSTARTVSSRMTSVASQWRSTT